MSWKFEVHGCGDPEGHFTSNSLRFETREEAQTYGDDLGMRWMGFDESRVVESDEPVTHIMVRGNQGVRMLPVKKLTKEQWIDHMMG